MNASVRAAAAHLPQVDPVYTLRDDLAHAHQPVNAHERMLITAIAQAWQRLQRAYDLERRVHEKTDPLDLFNNDLDRFKALARHIAECERIWRRAVEELERAKRRRPEVTSSLRRTFRSAPRPPLRTETTRPDLPEPVPESGTPNPLNPRLEDSA